MCPRLFGLYWIGLPDMFADGEHWFVLFIKISPHAKHSANRRALLVGAAVFSIED